MPIYIVTRQNRDGSFDEVGTNNRTVVSGYKTYRNAFRFAINPFGAGKVVRVEMYNNTAYGNPVQVFTAVTHRND